MISHNDMKELIDRWIRCDKVIWKIVDEMCKKHKMEHYDYPTPEVALLVNAIWHDMMKLSREVIMAGELRYKFPTYRM